ncbi:hypothetical protein Droror1_Dr00026184 [Drosera rotundifolia]
MKPLMFILVALLLGRRLVVAEGTTRFDFGTLTLSTLKLLGDAHISNASLRLTRDLPVPNSGAGVALYSHPVQFRRNDPSPSLASFTSFFTIRIRDLNPSSIGGGMAFLLTPEDDAVGPAGGWMGLNGTTGFVAVEFDTRMDEEFGDVNGNHVGVDLGKMVSEKAGDLGSVGVDLKGGDAVNCWIKFDYSSNGLLSVWVSYEDVRPNEAMIELELDLGKFVKDFMYVGFSGSTQGSTEMHSVEWWSFSSSFDEVGSTMQPSPVAGLNVSTSNVTHPLPPSIAPVVAESIRGDKREDCRDGGSCQRNHGVVAGVVTTSAFFVALFAGGVIWVFARKRKHARGSESFPSELVKMPKEFTHKELRLATRGFDSNRIIGHGAFGTVYRGVLPRTGDLMAVKRCSRGGEQGKSEFFSELSIIGSLRHRNLVRLQGWCHEKGEILLVYDLMPNGSLDKALFESRIVLPWPQRLKILLNVASALAYLHQECENQVIHRDVKASNIMLDERFNARLGDFGLAREIEHDRSPDPTAAAGTMGYLAPEYLITGRATEKTDVFSYGAVVLEVASGRRPIERECNDNERVGISSNLVEWVWSLHREGRLQMAADPRLKGEFDEGEMTRVLLVGLACSHPDPLVRPSMRAVIRMLVGEAEVPVVPRAKPTSMTFSTSQLLLNLQDSVSDCNAMLTLSSSSLEHSSIYGAVDELV